MSDTVVFEESPRTYYTRIPNLIDDSDLTPHAYRLYGHLRRVAGDTGACWKSTETLAKACRMSAGMVSKCKQELVAAGFVRIEEKHNEHGQYHHITIVDVWHKNAAAYSADSHDELGSSHDELPVAPSSHSEQPTPRGSSHSETKKNHAEKKNQTENPTDSAMKKPTHKKPEVNGIGPWFQALAMACSIDLNAATGRQKGMLKDSAVVMRDDVKTTPEQIEAFRQWWDTTDWRGKQGQAPTVSLLRERWGEFAISDMSDTQKVIRLHR